MAKCRGCNKSISKLEWRLNLGFCNECSLNDLDNIDIIESSNYMSEYSLNGKNNYKIGDIGSNPISD